ncbi:hypothetical protein BX600DRAFT_514067 [Xylariales sp. PMI_506]|nr:hypothetical protein BX600DRAFT_514067 [Xylariales sp. PMI_506]
MNDETWLGMQYLWGLRKHDEELCLGHFSSQAGASTPSPYQMDEPLTPPSSYDPGLIALSDESQAREGLDGDHKRRNTAKSTLKAEVPSINQLARQRVAEDKEQSVTAWMNSVADHSSLRSNHESDSNQPGLRLEAEDDNIISTDIPLGNETENKHVTGQAYYRLESQEAGFHPNDLQIIHQSRNWADAPLCHPIESVQYQPESSQAAMERFQRLMQDNESVVSRAASWGTRRRSLPSDIDATEGVISGNIFKKLSLPTQSTTRQQRSFRNLSSLAKKLGTAIRKRKGINDTEDSIAGKAIPARAIPRLGLPEPITDPPFGRSNSFRRGLPGSMDPPQSTSPLFSSRLPQHDANWPTLDAGDDNNSEDIDLDNESTANIDTKTEDIEPTYGGFRQLILRLNPHLKETNEYLVNRIAHQMLVRYKSLLNAKVRHLQSISQGRCSSGPRCISSQGSTLVLSHVVNTRPSSGPSPPGNRDQQVDDDLDVTHIMPKSFPPGIPMPPAPALPAQFECQICFQALEVLKPSDWTKHVHADVQPFTCTWERCRDPKMFKRKVDWLRHENEAHRHVEWWTCDVGDCRHTIYRQDNFMRHLVRDHRFPEPYTNRKSTRRNSITAMTWERVDRCHTDSVDQPQSEPCRFCGKVFPTWKKLTDHLTTHMEQISLLVLKMVESKGVETDTIISPASTHPLTSFSQPLIGSGKDLNVAVFHATQPQTSPLGHIQAHLQTKFDPLAYRPSANHPLYPWLNAVEPPKSVDSGGESHRGEFWLRHEGTDWDIRMESESTNVSIPHLEHNPIEYIKLEDRPKVDFDEEMGLNHPEGERRLMVRDKPAQFVEVGVQVDLTPCLGNIAMSLVKSTTGPQLTNLRGPFGIDIDDSMQSVTGSTPSSPPRKALSRTRQVGLATIRIDLISLLKRFTVQDGTDDNDNDASDYSTDSECDQEQEVYGHDTAPRESDGDSQDKSPSEERTGQCSSSVDKPIQKIGNGRRTTRDDDDDDRQERDESRRKRTKPNKKGVKRFACPYQVHEAALNCLKPGPRNPDGGCASIYRLRQHLSRKHMISSRCPRCWRSFDKKQESDEHRKQQYQCEEKVKPECDRFMSPENETEIERTCRGSSDEETWYNLFRLLVPGMENRYTASLMCQYWPYYYIPNNSTFMIPSIPLEGSMFPPLGSSGETAYGELNAERLESDAITESHVLPITSSAIFPAQSTNSQTLATPIFEVFSVDDLDIDPSSLYTSSDQSQGINTQPSASFSLEPSQAGATTQTSASSVLDLSCSWGNSMLQPTAATSLAASPLPVAVDNSPPSDPQLKRNYDRLKVRHRRAEEEVTELRKAREVEVTELRKAKHERLKDLNCLDELLEGIMESENLGVQVFEKLMKMSSVLADAKKEATRAIDN